MWDFIGIIWEQLSETFRWFFLGFLTTIAVLILLYRYHFINNTGGIAFIKKVSYYLFLPLYMGIISWFFSATYILQKDAQAFAHYSVNKIEDLLLPQLSKYIISLSKEYTKDEITSRDELVDSYLMNSGYKNGDLTTTAMRWTLTNGLSMVEESAIKHHKSNSKKIKSDYLTIIIDYLLSKNGIVGIPASYIEDMSNETINYYSRSVYWLLFIMSLPVLLVLSLEFYFGFKRKRKKELISPFKTTVENSTKIEQQTPQVDNQKKIN